MKIEISSRKEEPLFKRESLVVTATFDGKTPSRSDFKQKLGTQLKLNPDLIVIRRMNQKFGDTTLSCEARIYKDVNTLKSIEHEHLVKKNQPKASGEKADEGTSKTESHPKAEVSA